MFDLTWELLASRRRLEPELDDPERVYKDFGSRCELERPIGEPGIAGIGWVLDLSASRSLSELRRSLSCFCSALRRSFSARCALSNANAALLA